MSEKSCAPPDMPSSCCASCGSAAPPCCPAAQFASLSDEFQLLVREIVAHRMDVGRESVQPQQRYVFRGEGSSVDIHHGSDASAIFAGPEKRKTDVALRRRYDRLKRDFNERVDQKAGFYRRYARQVDSFVFLDPHIQQLKQQHCIDMDAQKEQYEERIRALKRQLADKRGEVERRTTEFYMTRKFDLERKEARRREQELELKISKLESDAQAKDATLRSMHEARRRERAEVKDLRRALEEFESTKAELVQLRTMRPAQQRDDVDRRLQRDDRLQASLAAERRRADANYDSFDAARADLVRALAYESALLLAYRSLRAEFVEESGGRRPRTRRPLREDEGLGAASEEEVEDEVDGGWGVDGEIDS